MSVAEEVCSNCRYWTQADAERKAKVHDGECHRYSPEPGPARSAVWPFTNEQEWCGEHELQHPEGERAPLKGKP